MIALKQQDIKFLENLKEEAIFLFEHIVNNGINEEDAIEMVKVVVKDNDLYLRKSSSISVPIRFKLSWLQENTKDRNDCKPWDSMSYKEKDKLLWELGMDTRSQKYEEGKLFCGENTPKGYKYNLTEFVYGQERLDKAWLNNTTESVTNVYHYASEEARQYDWFRKHGRGAMFS